MPAEFPLRLVIRAVDKATAPLRAVNQKIRDFTAPVRDLNNKFKALSREAGIPALTKGFKSVGHHIGEVGKEVFELGKRFLEMEVVGAFALVELVKGAMESGVELGKMAKQVGLGVDEYAQLQFAAGQAGVGQEEFNSSMSQFNKRLGEAKAGGGPLLSFLNKVSSSLARDVVHAKSTEAALELMTGAFAKVTDPAKRAALSAELFGKGSMQMGQFLGMGSEEIEKLKARFEELSGSQEGFADGAEELHKATRETETAFLGLRNAAAAELFPALSELAKGLSDLLAGHRGDIRKWAKEAGEALLNWVKSGGLERVVEGIKKLGSAIEKIGDKIGGMENLFSSIALIASAPLIGSVVSLAGSLWKLGAIVLPIVVRWGMLLLPIIGNIASALWGGFIAGWTAAWPIISAVGSAIASAAAAAAPFIIAAAALAAAGFVIWKEWDNLKLLFTDFTKPGGLLLTLKEMFLDIKNMNPFEWLKTAGQWWGKNLGITGGDKAGGAAPNLGAEGAAPKSATSDAHVTLDINGLPPGSRVTKDKSSSADLDMSLGYSMMGGG